MTILPIYLILHLTRACRRTYIKDLWIGKLRWIRCITEDATDLAGLRSGSMSLCYCFLKTCLVQNLLVWHTCTHVTETVSGLVAHVLFVQEVLEDPQEAQAMKLQVAKCSTHTMVSCWNEDGSTPSKPVKSILSCQISRSVHTSHR